MSPFQLKSTIVSGLVHTILCCHTILCNRQLLKKKKKMVSGWLLEIIQETTLDDQREYVMW